MISTTIARSNVMTNWCRSCQTLLKSLYCLSIMYGRRNRPKHDNEFTRREQFQPPNLTTIFEACLWDTAGNCNLSNQCIRGKTMHSMSWQEYYLCSLRICHIFTTQMNTLNLSFKITNLTTILKFKGENK